jgi:phosphomannomutase
VNPQIFREYDIRGLADRELTDEVARAIGRASPSV